MGKVIICWDVMLCSFSDMYVMIGVYVCGEREEGRGIYKTVLS